MKDIDYDMLVNNLDHMINLLEFDSMRSPGKAKLNAPTLESLYNMKERYAKATSKKGGTK